MSLLPGEHDTIVAYLQSIDRRCEQGFQAVDDRLEDVARARAECRRQHDERMSALESWKTWLLGAAAVVGLVVSAVSVVLASDISELRKQRQAPIVRAP